MIITLILRVFLYLIQCTLTLISKNDLPSFLEILIFELVLELFEHCTPIQSFDGDAPDSTLGAPSVTTVNELIPIVHCFTVWKICEALDLKAKFVPLPGTTALPRTPHRGVDQTTIAPVVASFSVWKICQALDLPATYSSEPLFFGSRTNRYQRYSKLLFLNCARH
ncbi:hypothetical protein TNCV_2746511 [Trichonephila clavipes]|nr:hypothetical protein TNCV_2746511 [Trichonephila clavipes]